MFIEIIATLLSGQYVMTFALISGFFYYRSYFSYLWSLLNNVWYLIINISEIIRNIREKWNSLWDLVAIFNREIQKRRLDIDIIDDRFVRIGFYYNEKYAYTMIPYRKNRDKDKDVEVDILIRGKYYNVTQHPGFDYYIDPSEFGGHYRVNHKHIIPTSFRISETEIDTRGIEVDDSDIFDDCNSDEETNPTDKDIFDGSVSE